MSLLEQAQQTSQLRLLYCCTLKRFFDIVVSGLALLLLSIPLLLVALVVRLSSPGPVIFRQERVGRGGTRFVTYKFRTMRHDPNLPLFCFVDENGVTRHKIAGDPRVTRVGRYLRRSSIDELPQLLNVLRGDMSLIGPRPELPEIVERYQPWQHRRHVVRPGLTGWWQVHGRSQQPMHEHTELDLYYIEHLSARLDARILVKTVRQVLTGLGAF